MYEIYLRILSYMYRYDTISEGIGIDRLTANFSAARIDDAFVCSDQEAVDMSRYLLHNEGMLLTCYLFALNSERIMVRLICW